jgi:hypothetical protein
MMTGCSSSPKQVGAFATSVAAGVPVWRRYVVDLTFRFLRIDFLSRYPLVPGIRAE